MPPPPPDPCKSNATFHPCTCDIKDYKVESLDLVLEQPIHTPERREEVAANVSANATEFTRAFRRARRREDAIVALRLFDSYLGLVRVSDDLGTHALLNSIAIYCELGCRFKAETLATELRRYHRYDVEDFTKVMGYCDER